MKYTFLFFFAAFNCGLSDQPNNTQQKFASTENVSENTNKRKAVAENTINLVDYGAKGLGIPSIKEDTTALRNAIAFLNKNGGGKLYIPNPPKFYAFAGDGVFVGNNIEIYGDGKGKSEIRNVSPTSGDFLNGPIFLFSTYGPSDNINIFQPGIDHYPIQDAKLNDKRVVLKTPANGSKLYVGEIIVLGAGKYHHGTETNKSRFYDMELNEIAAINNGTIELTYPLSVPLSSKNQQPPVIVNINNTQVMKRLLGIKNGTSKDIYIHDMTLTQAQTDELNNNASVSEGLRTGLTGVFQPGGAFRSTFKNLKIESYGGLDGNMFTRCMFSDIDLIASKKLVDLGYGSSFDTLNNIKWEYSKSPASDIASSFIVLNDGTHNILINNVNASGGWTGESIVLLSEVKNITVRNSTFNFPDYHKTNPAIIIFDKDVFSRNINFSRLDITVKSAGTFLRIAGSADPSGLSRNINVNYINFKGRLTSAQEAKAMLNTSMATNPKKAKNAASRASKANDENHAIFVKNVRGLKLNNVTVPSGDIEFENCEDSEIENITAPDSDVTVKGSKRNLKLNQLSVKTVKNSAR